MFSVPSKSPIQNNREAWHDLAGFISAMRITMLLFHPVSYRVGHHRHHRSTSLRRALVYSIHVTLLHSPSRFTLVASPVLRTENFNRPLHNFHWIQFLSRATTRAARARSYVHGELRRRCGGQCVSYYPPYWSSGVYTEAFTDRSCFNYRSRSLPSRDDGALRFDPRTRMECKILTARRTARANEIRCKQVLRATIARRSTVRNARRNKHSALCRKKFLTIAG